MDDLFLWGTLIGSLLTLAFYAAIVGALFYAGWKLTFAIIRWLDRN